MSRLILRNPCLYMAASQSPFCSKWVELIRTITLNKGYCRMMSKPAARHVTADSSYLRISGIFKETLCEARLTVVERFYICIHT